MSEFINTIDELGDDVVIDSIITRTITEFKDNRITKVRDHAFHSCTALINVELPNATAIGKSAFSGCTALTNVELPSITTVGYGAFSGCTALTEEGFDFSKITQLTGGNEFQKTAIEYLYLPNLVSCSSDSAFGSCPNLKEVVCPKLTYVGRLMFDYSSALEKVDLYVATSIGWNVNRSNTKLKALIIRTPSVCSASDPNIFGNSGFSNGTTYAYVPSALVDSYKAATNWSTYADQIRALEDYTVDGTTTGELDETKI